MSIMRKIGLFSIFALLTGCSTVENMPLIFGQSQTVGISISSSAADQGGEFTLGYKDRDIAIVPVTVKQSNGDSTLVKSTVSNSQDAMSVLGQFEINTGTHANNANVGLGKFFATGVAAQQLATGFKKKLGGGD